MSRLPSGTRATPHRTPAGAPCSASILGRDRRVGRSGSDARPSPAGDAFAACGQGGSSTPLARFLRVPPLALPSPPPAPRPICTAATARASAEAGPPSGRPLVWSISSGRPRSRRRAGAANSRHCVANAAAASASTRRTLASLHAAAPPCARHSRASRHLAVAPSPDLDAAPAAAPPPAANGKSSAAKLAWCAQNGVGVPNTAWPPPPAPSSLCSPAAPALCVVPTAAAAAVRGAAAASGATYTW
mmetsp:Transcript_30214/g.96519  ORF Transcript_30214/g.96519 Transcript_30214/m.96519 type:complete len:245 (+) Transcript_30214:279-1013(+)